MLEGKRTAISIGSIRYRACELVFLRSLVLPVSNATFRLDENAMKAHSKNNPPAVPKSPFADLALKWGSRAICPSLWYL